MEGSAGLGPLNLSKADTSGFDAIEPGRYLAEVFKMETDAVKNADGTGKMPAGTPMIKIQYKLLGQGSPGDGIYNRRVFQTLVVPPADYDEQKANRMQGMIVNLFVALGDDEATVRSDGFNPDFLDYIGRELVVVVGKEPKKDRQGNIIKDEFNNPVKGTKPADTLSEVDASTAGAPAGGLL